MNTNEGKTKIGQAAILKIAGLSFQVEVLDHRVSFGRDDFQVKPKCGYGDKWVSDESITFEETIAPK